MQNPKTEGTGFLIKEKKEKNKKAYQWIFP